MKMILYSLVLFAFLNIPKAALSQQIKDSLDFSFHIRHSEGVIYINDKIHQKNGVYDGYFVMKPFDVYTSYFVLEYLVFNLDSPLTKNTQYELTIDIKRKREPLHYTSINPELLICLSHYPAYDGLINSSEIKTINNLQGIFLPVSSNKDFYNTEKISTVFKAKGNENTIIVGCFGINADNKDEDDIKKLKNTAVKYLTHNRKNDLNYLKEYFGFLEKYEPIEIIAFIQSLNRKDYRNPTYIIHQIKLQPVNEN